MVLKHVPGFFAIQNVEGSAGVAAHSVTNLHFLYYAPPIDEAFYPRDVLVVDEAHNLEETLIAMGRRTIHPKIVNAIKARPFDFAGEDRKLLNVLQVRDWLKYFESAITHAQASNSDEKEKRDYESLREAIISLLTAGIGLPGRNKEIL